MVCSVGWLLCIVYVYFWPTAYMAHTAHAACCAFVLGIPSTFRRLFTRSGEFSGLYTLHMYHGGRVELAFNHCEHTVSTCCSSSFITDTPYCR